MFKVLLVLSLLISGSAFAQNMAEGETYENSYKDMPDGSSRYVGKCSTHEDYEKIYFKKGSVIQKYVEPHDLSEAQIKALIAKFDRDLFVQVLKTLDMYDIAGKDESEVTILKDYFDDFLADTLVHTKIPGLNLIRIGFGVGGGNGGYMVFNKTKNGSKNVYQMMSYTFDGDMNYCDKKVWMK